MNFHILTLFPDMVTGALAASITGRAIEQKKISVETVNIRDYSEDRHRKVDDYPYGGGAGMLMQAQPVYGAWADVCGRIKKSHVRTVYVTPQGSRFSQRMAEDFAKETDLVILCGHYEGIDERVLDEIATDYVSIGDYVLTGGELAAMVIVDAVSRLVPGVLSNDMSAETESFHGSLLEYPQYTRPEVWRGRSVPQILLSGNQRKIGAWRLEQAVKRTEERRPDLYGDYAALQACREQMMAKKLLHMDMIQLIDRGRAVLLYHEGAEILLEDKVTGLCFHADAAGKGGGGRIPEEVLRGRHSFIFHEKNAAERICARLDMKITCACSQAVLTRREKLPVSGLYRADGRPMDRGRNRGLVIRPLDVGYAEVVAGRYHLLDDPAYIKSRLERGQMYGAFLPLEEPDRDGMPGGLRRADGDEAGAVRLVGFIGYHAEGSIGMLEVFPEYRRRGIAMALETYIMNLALERGWIPYGQIMDGNGGSVALQKKLGLCVSGEQLYWAAPKREAEGYAPPTP